MILALLRQSLVAGERIISYPAQELLGGVDKRLGWINGPGDRWEDPVQGSGSLTHVAVDGWLWLAGLGLNTGCDGDGQ